MVIGVCFLMGYNQENRQAWECEHTVKNSQRTHFMLTVVWRRCAELLNKLSVQC